MGGAISWAVRYRENKLSIRIYDALIHHSLLVIMSHAAPSGSSHLDSPHDGL